VLFGVFFVISIFSGLVVAQPEGSVVSGVVVDPPGAYIPDVDVVVTSPGRHDGRTFGIRTKANSNGRFQFDHVPAGRYNLTVTHALSGISTEELIEVRAGIRLEITVKMGETCKNLPPKDSELETDDMAYIMKLALKEALAGLLPAESSSDHVLISTHNVDRNWFAGHDPGIRLEFFTPDELGLRAHAKRTFYYLSFSKPVVRRGCVGISMSDSWVGSDGNFGNMSGAGITLEFRKIDGRWASRRVWKWIS
jgi:hypothetical protein